MILPFSRQKHVGAWNYLQITEGLEAFTYAIFSRQLGYTRPEIDVICANIRREIKNPNLHALFHLYVLRSPISIPIHHHASQRLHVKKTLN